MDRGRKFCFPKYRVFQSVSEFVIILIFVSCYTVFPCPMLSFWVWIEILSKLFVQILFFLSFVSPAVQWAALMLAGLIRACQPPMAVSLDRCLQIPFIFPGLSWSHNDCKKTLTVFSYLQAVVVWWLAFSQCCFTSWTLLPLIAILTLHMVQNANIAAL